MPESAAFRLACGHVACNAQTAALTIATPVRSQAEKGTGRVSGRTLITACLLVPLAANGQIVVPGLGGGLEQIRPAEEPFDEPGFSPDAPAEPVERIAPAEPRAPSGVPPEAVRFRIATFGFQGNDTIPTAELRASLADVERRLPADLAYEEIEALRASVEGLYAARGLYASVAVPFRRIGESVLVPSIVDGRLEFRIFERSLTLIDVQGNKLLRDRYVASRLEQRGDGTLSLPELQERILLLQQDRNIERIDAELAPVPGRPNEAELRVEVEERPAFSYELAFDNRRAPSVGELQPSVSGTVSNITGWGEQLRFLYQKTEGFHDAVGLLRVPVSARGTEIWGRLEDSASEVVEGVLQSAQIESSSQDVSVGVNHPLLHERARRLDLGLRFAHRKSKTFLLGRPFSYSPGVQNGSSRVDVFRLSLDWLDRRQSRVIAARSMLSFGTDAFGGTSNPGDLPDSNFVSWLGQFQWVQRVTDRGDLLLIRGTAQFTSDPLLPIEKYPVGGALSVRGYRENQLVRDNGWAATLEARIPIGRVPVPGVSRTPDDGSIQFAAFVDAGRAWDNQLPNPYSTLAGIGVGLRWRPSRKSGAEIYFAYPIEPFPDPVERSLQDDGIYFRISTTGL